jgi:meso-butanediol dehydrogenase/(S,S)-butanediol dehydrogenase/diacetyl reductase
MRLAGKAAVITGGGAGLGEAMCSAFAAEGARVMVADRDVEAAQRVAGALSGAQACPVDVADAAQVEAMVEAAVDAFGKLDVIVNNAGIGGTPTPVPDVPLEDWDRLLAINLSGVFYGCKYAWPHLERSRGAIVNISSMAGLVSERGFGAYSASKAGVLGFTRACALDGARRGIRANAICPAFTQTKMVEELLSSRGDADAMRKAYARAIPMGRLGEPGDIAAAAVYLASDEASFVTGIALPVDGGLLAR